MMISLGVSFSLSHAADEDGGTATDVWAGGQRGVAAAPPVLTVTTPCPERRKISFTQKSVQKLKLMLLFKDPSSRGKIPNNLGSGKGTQNLLLILGICEYVYQVRWQVVREVLLRSGRDIM